MQQAAQYSAAIEILDEISRGTPAEKALLAWARGARYAGSKDRAAVRDIVFDCLRKRASFGGRFGQTGRGLAMGRAFEMNEIALFDGEGFAPPALDARETRAAQENWQPSTCEEKSDFPSPFCEMLQRQYGAEFFALADAMRARAPLDLRVNRVKATREEAIDLLAREHIFTEKLEDEDALRVTHNPRRVQNARAYTYGFVELQDYSSQLVARMAGVKAGCDVLDYCAGGGGKSLALGSHMRGKGRLDAWDIKAARMAPLLDRAARAGLKVNILSEKPSGQYDLVFVDAPCSGSGAWRRTPDGKWRLGVQRFAELLELQSKILDEAALCVRQGGQLVYATCSLFAEENQDQIDRFCIKHPEFALKESKQLTPLNASDGFFGARFVRK